MATSKQAKLKLPPQNEDAEQAVLGSILIDKNAIYRVADLIEPGDFYFPKNEKVFEAILTLHEKHQPIDVLTVTTFLKEQDLLTAVGGSSYLADLTNQVTTASHASHYAEIVKKNKILRDLIRASAEISEEAFDVSKELDDTLAFVEKKIFDISQKSTPQNLLPIAGELMGAQERMAKLADGGDKLRGITSGFPAIDNKLSGFQKSDLIILGARPSTGKTSLALDVARNAAHAGAKVGIFSLEMSREQVIDRIISAESGIPLWNILTGRIHGDDEFTTIQNALDRLSNLKIFIDDSSALKVMEMHSMARRLQMEHGLDLLIVDYLQLVRPRTNSDNVVTQITEISHGLKALARDLKVPVLCLSQLSRGVEQRDHKMPRLSDLRDSGSIEQDADVVMFIYRKSSDENIGASDQSGDVPITQILIAKHRNGPIGEVDLMFDKEHASFKTIDKRYEEIPL
jgi:replicative DNA helicase